MSRTESTMVQLGTKAPTFTLLDVTSDQTLTRDDLLAPDTNPKHGLLLLFVCPHCPYVKHVEQELGRIGRDYFDHGRGPIAMAAIMSNDIVQYPQDGPDEMLDQATRNAWHFPYLLDHTQQVARSYDAACTPDFFLFDAALTLVYRGQLDASRPRRGDFGNDQPVTGQDLRAALDAVIAGQQPSTHQQTSLGCNIKWRSTTP